MQLCYHVMRLIDMATQLAFVGSPAPILNREKSNLLGLGVYVREI